MFSGIISALGNVKNITYNDIYSVDIEITKINLEDFEKSDNLIKIGCSIACSGVCLSLTKKKDNILTFDIKNLPTGNYNLVCDIRNSINELVITKKKDCKN